MFQWDVPLVIISYTILLKKNVSMRCSMKKKTYHSSLCWRCGHTAEALLRGLAQRSLHRGRLGRCQDRGESYGETGNLWGKPSGNWNMDENGTWETVVFWILWNKISMGNIYGTAMGNVVIWPETMKCVASIMKQCWRTPWTMSMIYSGESRLLTLDDDDFIVVHSYLMVINSD